MSIKASIKEIIYWLDKRIPRSIFYSFIMSPTEKALFDKSIRNSLIYLEFGMGGSTFRVLQKSKAKVYSIDSSTDWISQMRGYLQIRKMERNGRLSLIHVDIGPTRVWGKPVNNDHRDKFPDYSSEVFNSIPKDSIDTVLIDGRFRVACTLKTILESHQNENIQIIIHDFFIRKEYDVVLKYIDVVQQADTLGIFKIKENIDLNSVRKDYDIYKYNAE